MIDRIMDNRDSISDDEKVQNYCMTCHHVSYKYGERESDNPDYDGDGIPEDEAQVVCPKCESTYYMIASDEEIKKYGSDRIINSINTVQYHIIESEMEGEIDKTDSWYPIFEALEELKDKRFNELELDN